MKYMFASDVHGSAYYCRKMLDAYREEKAERLVLLGDLLYHGPRNDLPKDYAPKEVISMLNALKREIYAVRGNCEAEVDQMVLQFPVLADYMILFAGERAIYATHGHVYNENHLPPLKPGDVLLHGHTHVLRAEEKDGLAGKTTNPFPTINIFRQQQHRLSTRYKYARPSVSENFSIDGLCLSFHNGQLTPPGQYAVDF